MTLDQNIQNIELITTVLAGIVLKLYDDLKDGGFVQQQSLLASSLYLILAFLTAIISYNDFIFAMTFYSFEMINYLHNPSNYKGIDEKSALYAYPILIFLSLPSASLPTYYDVGAFILFSIPLVLEDLKIQEQFSKKKLLIRVIQLILILIFLNIYSSVLTKGVVIFLFEFGYLSVSVCFQLYYQFRKENKKLSKETK